jgi:hypothetical protein
MVKIRRLADDAPRWSRYHFLADAAFLVARDAREMK